jgi:chromosome segregation protein
MTAVALLFALYLVKPAPFCVLDELDAPLDDANVDRFIDMLDGFSKETQFIVVTHNRRTMESADRLYGVTMAGNGVSALASVSLEEAKTE